MCVWIEQQRKVMYCYNGRADAAERYFVICAMKEVDPLLGKIPWQSQCKPAPPNNIGGNETGN
jgi:hypothetical protein